MKVIYRLDRELDKRMALASLESSSELVFSEYFILPQRDLFGSPGAVLEHSVDQFYDANEETLERKRQEFSLLWSRVEEHFFGHILSIFEHRLRSGCYVGYLSILDHKLRLSEANAFHLFLEHPHGPLYLTARAVVRFLFLDYIKLWYAGTLAKKPSDSGVIWQLTELFTDIILSTPSFVSMRHSMPAEFPAELEPCREQAHSVWKKGQGIDHWLENMAFVLGKTPGRSLKW